MFSVTLEPRTGVTAVLHHPITRLQGSAAMWQNGGGHLCLLLLVRYHELLKLNFLKMTFPGFPTPRLLGELGSVN